MINPLFYLNVYSRSTDAKSMWKNCPFRQLAAQAPVQGRDAYLLLNYN